MLRVHFTDEDLIRVRVASAPDPLWEILLSLHALQVRRGPNAIRDWRGQVLSRIQEDRAQPMVKRLVTLAPIATYVPDFLTPIDASYGLEAGITAVRSTPRRRLRDEMASLAAVQRLPSWAQQIAEGRSSALDGLGNDLQNYYDLALAPSWRHIHKKVDADRGVRGRALLEGGVERLLEGLGPAMRWRRPVLEVDYPFDKKVQLDGRGLLLVPSFFCWRWPIGIADPALTPVLAYPVQHVAPPTAAATDLKPLLGATRAAILEAATVARSTGDLARLLDISPATVSYHTSVLRGAGLIRSRREVSAVVHTVTSLGAALLNPEHDG